jgi:hypothetical protein
MWRLVALGELMVSGGSRKGAGRKARPTPKSKCIWCGQIADEQRDFIMQWLSPDERFSVLMAAANKACSGFAAGRVKNKGSAKAAIR